ncbi:lysozyme [Saccharomonospora sp. CUA-673]|uniref:lysozyme n=1 Tax=Saccharomonospora sp. CUA-673 TaxID=1904969 RepID=UPI000969617B|nr:lysozyme [Saccharomonospora sp. CUA-673]OLT38654.1 lysozyme [Saccharomonospora sp. CUA-673]
MSTKRRIRRGLRSLVVAGSIGALLLGALSPAGAAPNPLSDVTDSVDAFEIGNHSMGSQIARVEGELSSAVTKARAMLPQGVTADGTRAQATVQGIDVASWQGNVNWRHWWNQGKRFAYVKATEATSYKNPYFTQQYNGSYNVGMIRGAYHFAVPNSSSGRAQANYFVNNGGGWSADGKTLPGALDMEYNPYGDNACYGLSKAQMASWIRDFHDTYHSRTGRHPVIYTSTSWWNMCVGTAQSFGSTVPLWVARYSDSVGALPNGWNYHTFWQYTSSPLDQNSFNGSYDRLRVLARG